MSVSLKNEDYLLGVPFCADEVDAVLGKPKSGKAAGHDLLQAEHLKYGGPALRKWIKQICSAITDLECVPDPLKISIIILFLYTRGEVDPLDTNSYRGITLTSVLAKVPESLLLSRLRSHLIERDIPHLNQTAYWKKVSCAEAMTVSQYSPQKREVVYVLL